MWKWVLKQAIKFLAEPIVDAVIEVLRIWADKTETNIDNDLVDKIEAYKDVIIGFIISNVDNIAKKV